MAIESQGYVYSVMLPPNGNVLPNKLPNRNQDCTVTLKF